MAKAVPVATAVPVKEAGAPPPTAPPGGEYKSEQYIGIVTMIVCIIVFLLFWPATAAPLCCPCDTRTRFATRLTHAALCRPAAATAASISTPRSPAGTVYVVNGTKYAGTSGAIVPPGECCGFPCFGPSA